ncbi:2Fe-2S iron-sulfur cluster binding domain-containing protein [Halorarum halophilum]|uniref:2Fe-2S iron-sulfur cluster binding domain-containing protein n=1 Tax=Halorarum halophilum TaxID=2743090 RepID=A0A7D5KXE6_9EURY|nr:2Fe-2S iron-sulfur cluster-binding protein [Halobaculum halophilum]QLG28118.1 2Fe-2S iron-sulfur cluster binding domain-containing protein [Halobaculum halophilum]
MVDPVAVGFGAGLVLVFVALHFARGTGWEPTADISEEVLEERASTVPETDFPEPGNRAIGGGGGAVGAVPAGEEGELEEGGAAEESSSPADIPEDEVEYFEVEFVKEGATIELANNETVLEQGEEEGWDLPYACREGQCVSCAGQITDGGNAEDYVVHDNQQMLDDTELDEGYTLTCVAYPRADFTIETGEAP